MHSYRGYEAVSHGPLSQSKLTKLGKTGKISLTKEELSGSGFTTLFHPANAKMMKAAKGKKGVNLSMSGPEIMNDLTWHDGMGGSMHGGSVWSWLKDKAWPWLKQNVWPIIKPIVSSAVDQGAQMLGNYTGQPGLVSAGRDAVRNLTGVGMTTQQKRLAALTKARAAKSSKKINIMSAGSFRIN